MLPPDMIFNAGNGKGLPVWYSQPIGTKLTLEDFELATKNLCRYYGSIDWKLIQHLALGAKLIQPADPTTIAYYCAHDLHEVIVGDMNSGQKKYHDSFRKQELAWERHVHCELGLNLEVSPNPAKVKQADIRALVVEMWGLEHPGYRWAAYKHGSATGLEQAVFKEVKAMSLDECWEHVAKSIRSVKHVEQDRHTCT